MESHSERSSYDPQIVAGLGLIGLEFSRMEAALKRVGALLITPHQFVGEIATTRTDLRVSIERAAGLVQARLVDGELKTRVLGWIGEVDAARERRNALVHGHWLDLAMIVRVALKRKQLTHEFTDIEPEQLRDLAREMWTLHQEGTHLWADLSKAGFGGVTTVSDEGVSRAAPAPEYQVGPGKVSGRPLPRDWPGEALFEEQPT
ncbi:MAG: hypothetical protein JWN65_585 [Solirubrobacterales bacterium]|nr:hypothetical protein [Solirubrobacterales bacterium]